MTDEPEFPSARRRTGPPKRPPGLNLTPRQEKRAQAAEKLYSRARREGWTRARFYFEINHLRGTPPPAIRDNLIDKYVEPNHSRLRKRIPPGWTSRFSLQENLIEILHYAHVRLEEEGGLSEDQWVIVQQEGGYRIYVPPRSP